MSQIKNADDAVVVLRAFIVGIGSREMFDALEMVLAERDKLFSNGIEALGQVARLQEEARAIGGKLRNPFMSEGPEHNTWAWVNLVLHAPVPVIQKWCETSPDILWWLGPDNESAFTATEAQLRKAVFQWLAEGPAPYAPGGNL